jgi:hypothetical protein
MTWKNETEERPEESGSAERQMADRAHEGRR